LGSGDGHVRWVHMGANVLEGLCVAGELPRIEEHDTENSILCSGAFGDYCGRFVSRNRLGKGCGQRATTDGEMI